MSSDTRSPKNRTSADIDTFMIRCMSDFEYYAPMALKINTKADGLQPFLFNVGQYYLHKHCEAMLDKYGKIRIIICKARQIGFSTYVGGRAYWRTSFNHGYNTMIMTHEGEATKNLFEITKRYHENCPVEIRPHTKRSNQKELIFDALDSRYSVGTARTGDSGRSQKINFFHGSEVAYWKNADQIAAGAMEGIPNAPGTEVFLESTAAGLGGWYHGIWQGACYPGEEPPANFNGYWRIFVPWHWQQEYRMEAPDNFEPTQEELELSDLYGLDLEQLVWRRQKLAQKKGNVSQFEREYPITPEQAFNSALDNVLINGMTVARARKNFRDNVYQPIGKLILGCDSAREGDDDSCLVLRQGRVIHWYKRFHNKDSMEMCGIIIRTIKEYHIDHVCVDNTGGFGAGIIDRMIELGWGRRVSGIHFSSAALYPELYRNKRTEMMCNLRDWLKEGASVPDRDEISLDFCSITYKFDSSGDRIEIEKKVEAKKRIGKSPDILDASALTFALHFDQGSSESIEPEHGH